MIDLQQIKEDSNFPILAGQTEVVETEQSVPERGPRVISTQKDESLRQVWGDPREENGYSFSG